MGVGLSDVRELTLTLGEWRDLWMGLRELERVLRWKAKVDFPTESEGFRAMLVETQMGGLRSLFRVIEGIVPEHHRRSL